MTDTTPASKAVWSRCPACGTVMPNIKIALDGHRLNCPHDIQLRAQALAERVADLEEELEALRTAEPTSDPESVEDAPWPDEDEQPDIDEDDDEVDARPPLTTYTSGAATDAYGRPIQ